MIARVGEIVAEERAGQRGRDDDQRSSSTPASTCSRACSSRRRAWRTPSASSTACIRAPAAAGFRNFPESTTIKAPRIGEVYTRGHARRSRGWAARRRSRRPARPARRCGTSRAAASPRGCCTPRSARRGPTTLPRSPVIGTDAPVQYEQRDDIGAPRKRMPGTADVPDTKGALMQTPAPFEYERATSVEGAIASLQRLGSDARVIAGGHSLLPMMKLRLANPEHLIDINDLTELVVHPRGGRRDPDRRADAPRGPAEVRAARRALPAVPRRRERDRRSGRAQPRHDRRLAVPGRRGRGPLRGLLGGEGQRRDPRRRRRARRRDGRLPRRPVHDRGRRRRAADRGADPAAPGRAAARTRRSSAAPATGRSPPRRRRSGSTAGAIADAGLALSAVGLTTIHVTRAEELLRGKAPSEELFAQAGEIASADCSPDRRRPRAGRLQAPPRRRAHNTRPAARDRARACTRRPEHARLDHDQRRDGLARHRAAPAARALHPRDPRADRDPLGLRHLQLRRLRRADGRQAA